MAAIQWLFFFLLSVTVLFFVIGNFYFSELLFDYYRNFYDVIDEPIFAFNNFATINDMDFEGFNNESGADSYIVPNIIHYIRLDKKSWTFVEYVCLLSAYVYQRPDYIFIHTNVVDGFKGKYWVKIQRQHNLKSRIFVAPVQIPSNIFGQKLNNNKNKLFHASDIIRIQILMKYGGIFFDNDSYVLQNLNKYRKFEMTLGWPQNKSLGTMVLVAHKNARFLPLWLKNYRNYKADQWYYNAGDNPTKTILMKHPELVHREETRLGIDFMMREIFQSTDYFQLEKLDTVHLLINHRFYLDCFHKDYRYFNERNILHYPFNFSEMIRRVLNRNVLLNTSQSENSTFKIAF